MKTHGTGMPPWEFAKKGIDCVIETGAMVFHPETITLGDRVYLGHQAILKGYYKNTMRIGSGTWIGQQAFIHSGGGVEIGDDVGIGPGVKILSSQHKIENRAIPILHQALEFKAVRIGKGCDIGANAVILPGVELGAFCQVGAGAVVTKSFPECSVIAGVPAVVIRTTT